MAVGDETVGFNGIFEVNDGGGGSFQVVPKVESLGVPTYTVGTVQSKRLDLASGVVICLATLREGDSISVKIQHTKATYARFVAIRDARVAKNWRVTIPDDDSPNTIITFPGILTACAHDPLTAETINVFEARIQISGAQT